MVLVQFIELKPHSHAAVDKGQVNTISAIRRKLGNLSPCSVNKTE